LREVEENRHPSAEPQGENGKNVVKAVGEEDSDILGPAGDFFRRTARALDFLIIP
jgi:hypothetical protein